MVEKGQQHALRGHTVDYVARSSPPRLTVQSSQSVQAGRAGWAVHSSCRSAVHSASERVKLAQVSARGSA